MSKQLHNCLQILIQMLLTKPWSVQTSEKSTDKNKEYKSFFAHSNKLIEVVEGLFRVMSTRLESCVSLPIVVESFISVCQSH